ncbi:cation diffusion facilitator family transporter [Alkalitalea saponilacus]|uniref:Cation diffusion facilitator family transporter n=1 Tax=Alkalitalea saponilacus TaxID=889453 RepID=A0A1T5EBJ8_9BACT|nr:cation diffusion facilitator family transporter [Alkalitalea saponilacus]ASB49046.1 cation transporter [Alkalitalea saponilacus]SKB81273.1 cation diffusion facilitator family transporter [Alkalitalea saponilacus]
MKSKSPIIATWCSIVLNVLLFILKFWAGVVSNSVALLADAWHTLSDSFSSLAVLIGLKYSHQPADKNHPFGHGRAELIASLVVGVLLAVVGFNFLVESITKFRNREIVEFGSLAIWATAISIVVKEVMARYSIYIGKKHRYNSLVADGWHHRSDSITSVVILIGIFFGSKIWWIDSFLGLIVTAMIFYTTYGIMKDTISVLLGEAIDKEMVNSIVACETEVGESISLNPHHFKIHTYGQHTELTFHITLPGHFSLEKAHDIASKYERIVEEKLDVCVTIHVDAEE